MPLLGICTELQEPLNITGWARNSVTRVSHTKAMSHIESSYEAMQGLAWLGFAAGSWILRHHIVRITYLGVVSEEGR